MSYTDVFGGELIFPSLVSYNRIDSSVDVTLQWAREQQIEGVNVVADVLDINGTVANINVDMPDARNTSLGNKTTVNAIGEDFLLRDATGGTIQSVDQGQQWVIVLTDNSTEAGTWTTFQLGAATTLSDSSALAGAGLQPSGPLLEQIISSDVEAVTPFDVVTGDRAKCLIYTAGAGTCNLQAQIDNFFCMIRNSGSGTLNILPAAGLIDGSASLNLDPDGSCFVFTDGTDWYTIGLTVASVIAFDFVSIAVPGSGDFTLTGANLNRISYRFTGALTGNRRIIVPNTTQQYWVDNQTTGAFTLEVTTAAGSGQIIDQNNSAIVYCDATDVINAVSSTSVTFPITIGQGGTSATTAAGARSNLNAAFDGILIETQADSGLGGGGDLTANRQLVLDVSNLDTTPSPASGDFIPFEDIDDNLTYKATIADIVGSAAQISGTPLNNQIAVWVNGTDIEGDANFTFSGGAAGVLSVPNITGDATELSLTGYDENDDGFVIQDGARITFEDRAFANDVYLRNEGVGGGSGTLTMRADSSANFELRGPGLLMQNTAATALVSVSILASPDRLNFNDNIRSQGSVYITEKAAAVADTAGDGQLWVRNDTPNTLMFTRDNGEDVPLVERGSFTVDFGIGGGFSDSNVTTFQYVRIGDFVQAWIPAANLGNSNANSCFTIDAIPVALRPDTDRYSTGPVVDNASAIVLAQVLISTAGVISCFAPDSANPPDYGNDWTTSGVKGPTTGFSISWHISD